MHKRAIRYDRVAEPGTTKGDWTSSVILVDKIKCLTKDAENTVEGDTPLTLIHCIDGSVLKTTTPINVLEARINSE